MTSRLTDVADCGLHKRTPYGIAGVSHTQFSIARFSGAIKFNGENYTYFPDTDELVRDDVLRWLKKSKKVQINPPQKLNNPFLGVYDPNHIVPARRTV
jgi:hypothetical protein